MSSFMKIPVSSAQYLKVVEFSPFIVLKELKITAMYILKFSFSFIVFFIIF